MLMTKVVLVAFLIRGCLGFSATESLFDIGGDDLNFVSSPVSMQDNFQFTETDILEELYNTTRVTKRSTRSNLCTYQRSETQYYRS
uniref:Secreted protein n=1 Tax=Macrostomum lignano TaxID=282301 RepID=A0A1I8JF90_9PLAT